MKMNMVVDELHRKIYGREIEDAELVRQRLELSGIIEKFRNVWAIPSSGFSDWAAFEKWWNTQISYLSQQWRSSAEYKKLVQQQSLAKNNDAENIDWTIALKDPLYRFEWEIDQILNYLKISERARDFVKGILVTKNSPYKLPRSAKPEAKIKYNEGTGRNELWVRIWSETTQEDLKSKMLWNDIQSLKKKLHDYQTIKKQVPKYLHIHKQLFDWHFADGLTYKQIREKALTELKYRIKSNEDLGKILGRYKKRVGTRTPKTRN